jgi:hypothetical protein
MIGNELNTKISKCLDTFTDYADELGDLDQALGDGDLGITVSLGAKAAQEALAQLPESATPTEVVLACAKAFANANPSKPGRFSPDRGSGAIPKPSMQTRSQPSPLLPRSPSASAANRKLVTRPFSTHYSLQRRRCGTPRRALAWTPRSWPRSKALSPRRTCSLGVAVPHGCKSVASGSRIRAQQLYCDFFNPGKPRTPTRPVWFSDGANCIPRPGHDGPWHGQQSCEGRP